MLFSSFRDDVRVGRILTIAILAVSLLAVFTGEVFARSLGAAQIRVLGIQVNVDTRPDVAGVQSTMSAVKDIPSAVTTVVGVPGVSVAPNLPASYVVKAEISGPDFTFGPETLSAPCNGQMELPVFRNPGDYLLTNVRLEDGAGSVVLQRDPSLDPVVINVIDELLVTQVTSRPLSLDEIEELGIQVDEDNFQVMNFTVGLTLGSEPVEISMPVAIPTDYDQYDTPDFGVSLDQQSFDVIEIPNLQLVGFKMQPPTLPEDVVLDLPDINGVIVIPGDIAFLNQFFSVFIQATNTAPDGSGLLFQNAKAKINLPGGDDNITGTGDDPLRMAELEGGVIQEQLPLEDAQGQDTIVPQGTNQAEYFVEGLKEGIHTVKFDITGDLFVESLSQSFAMTGKAAGVVQVKNPTFNLVLAHPEVVRAGEDYSIMATVTNTSTSWANLFQLALNTSALSGCLMQDGETAVRTTDSIGPGQAKSFEFRMTALKTGKVSGTVFLADEGINGSFVLTTGVGDANIPLSPDTIVLPTTVQYLPGDPDLVFAATRLIGLAYSVATAPNGTLPEDVDRVSKSYVTARAAKLAQAGLHVRFGEEYTATVQDILMDYFGADYNRINALYPEESRANLVTGDIFAFDKIRRTTGAGANLSDVMGQLIGKGLDTQNLAQLQMQWAETFTSRADFILMGSESTGLPALLHLEDAQGKETGRTEPGADILREIPFADSLDLTDHANMLAAAALDSGAYNLDFAIQGAGTEISLVVPWSTGLVQASYDVSSLGAGAYCRLAYDSVLTNTVVTDTLSLQIDGDGDGSFEQTMVPVIAPVEDNPPLVLGVHQWGKGTEPILGEFEIGDALGMLVGVLYNEEITQETAESTASYVVEGIGLDHVTLQADRRMVFAQLNRPVGPFVDRSMETRNLEDVAGNVSASQITPINPDPELGSGGTFTGRVVDASGNPVAHAIVKYIQPVRIFDPNTADYEVTDVVVSSLSTDYSGAFSLDFVLENTLRDSTTGGKATKFMLYAEDPINGNHVTVPGRVAYNGQNMAFNLILRGLGAVSGTVYDSTGVPVEGAPRDAVEPLFILAVNVATGESFTSWVDADGYYSFPREYTTDGGTTYRAHGLPAGPITLGVTRSSDMASGVASVNLISGDSLTQDLYLMSTSGTVSGKVLESDGVTGASGVYVQIKAMVRVPDFVGGYEEAFSLAGAVYTDENGNFDFGSVNAGNIEILAYRKSTYEQRSLAGHLSPGGHEELTLVLPGTGATIRGYVKDASGNPVEEALVSSGLSLVETEEDGFFEFPGLPLGTITISAKGPNSQTVKSAKVQTFSSSDVEEIILYLDPEGTITGTVYEADGSTTVPYEKVQLWQGSTNQNLGVVGRTVTNSAGVFTFAGFPKGKYNVRSATGDLGDGGMTNASITYQGDVVDADIVFRGLGTIQGRVIQSNGTGAIADLVITRKVWRETIDANTENNYYLDYVEELGKINNAQIQQAVQMGMEMGDVDLSAPTFFILVSEPVLSTSAPDDGGAVTGEFVFGDDPGEVAVAGDVKVEAYGAFYTPATATGTIPPSTTDAGRVADVGDIILAPSTGQVSGTLYMPDDQTPVGEGVTVRLVNRAGEGTEITSLTDADGNYHFPLVLMGRFEMSADTGAPITPALTADDMETEVFDALNVRLQGTSSGALPVSGSINLDIRLRDVAGVHVCVNDETGDPVNQEVRVWCSSTDSWVTTDASGCYEFFPVPEGPFTIKAMYMDDTGLGMTSGQVPVNPANGHKELVNVNLGVVTTSSGEVVETPFTGTVTGTVYRADGSTLENPVEVTILASGIDLIATSDAQGAYTVLNVPQGFFSVEVLEPLTARTGSSTGVIQSEGQVVTVDVTLNGLGTVTGQVLSYDGAPVTATVDISLTVAARPDQPMLTRVDNDGFYTLPGIPTGNYAVTALDFFSGLTGQAYGKISADGETATTNITLEQCGTISGTVYAAGVYIDENGQTVDENGQGIADPAVEANATVRIVGPGTSLYATTDANGQFVASRFLPMGTFTLTARPEDTQPLASTNGATTTATLSSGGEVVEVSMAMSGHGAVDGVVLDSYGDPVSGATVTCESSGQFATGSDTVTTGASGVFSFASVPVGPFVLTVDYVGGSVHFGATAQSTLERHAQAISYLDGDGDTEHDAIRLGDTGNVTGVIYLDDGTTPADGAVVRLDSGDLVVVRQAGQDGAFLISNMPLGTYSVILSDPASNGVAYGSITLDTNGQTVDMGDITLDSLAPQVVAMRPANDAADVSPATDIVITFTELIDPATVSLIAPTLRVQIEGEAVEGNVTVSGAEPVITFTPNAAIPDLKRVDVILSADQYGFEGQLLEAGIRDLSGISLSSDYMFGFTTADSTPPEVVSLSPADLDHGVQESAVLRAEFNESIDPASVVSMTLETFGSPVAGVWSLSSSWDNKVLVFDPDLYLLTDRQYTATIHGPLRDMHGNAMSQNEITWTFSTLDTQPPAAVGLDLTAGELVFGNTVLFTADAGSSLDVDHVEFYIGDQLVHTDSSDPYVYSLYLDPSLGSSLALTAVAVDQDGNRSPLTVQNFALAANQPPSVTLVEPAAGDVSLGAAITVQVDASDDVALKSLAYTANGGAIGSGTHITNAANDSKSFSFNVPVDHAVGMPIEVRATATDSFGQTTEAGPVLLNVVDGLAPEVFIKSPVDGGFVDKGANLTVAVTATDGSGISEFTVETSDAATYLRTRIVDPPTSPASAYFTVAVDDDATPDQDVVITATALDTEGNTNQHTIRVNLTDTVPPTAELLAASSMVEPGLQATVQVHATDEVGVGKIQVHIPQIFTETREITPGTNINQSFNFSVPSDLAFGSQISVYATAWDTSGNTVGADPMILTTGDITAPAVQILAPAANSEVDPGQTVDITIQATDTYGVASVAYVASGSATGSGEQLFSPAASPAQETFTLTIPGDAPARSVITVQGSATDTGNNTGSASITLRVADKVAPVVTAVSPVNNAEDVDEDTMVEVTFDEAIDTGSVTTATMMLNGPDGQVVGQYSFHAGNSRVRIDPDSVLTYDAQYTLTLTTGITDVAGNALAAEYTSSFTVILPDLIPPEVTGVHPQDGATGVNLSRYVYIDFSESLDPATVSSTTVFVTDGSSMFTGEPTLSNEDKYISMLASGLEKGVTYTITVNDTVTDVAGNALASTFTSTFTTVLPDTTPPEVASITPYDGEDGVSVHSTVEAMFTEDIQAGSVTTDTFKVLDQGVFVPGDVSLDSSTKAVWTPQDALDIGKTYEVELTTGIMDLAGNNLAPFTSTFTTIDFAIITPVDGGRVVETQVVGIEADTSISTGINNVVFTMNGQELGADPTTPYVVLGVIPTIADLGGNSLSISAVAQGDSGEVARADITVTVEPLSADSDGDGLTNAEEISAGTDPFKDDLSQDSDGDGLDNGQEIALGTDPFDADSDNDGLSDGEEITVHLTNPLNEDSDGDSINDGDEIRWNLDPSTDDLASASALDTTGVSNLELAGVNVYSSIYIAPETTIRGGRTEGNDPLVLLSGGPVTISGVIDVSGGDGEDAVNTATTPTLGGRGVAGGADGGNGGLTGDGSAGFGLGAGGGGLRQSGASSQRAGGGGAGFATAGEDGSERTSTNHIGAGGGAYNSIQIEPLEGGSGGGGGSSGYDEMANPSQPNKSAGGGGGGAGGGVVYIRSNGVLTISATGEINADGGAGGNGAKISYHDSGAGAGGGSGGSIFLKAETLENNGAVHASGGIYGIDGSNSVRGGSGALGRIRIDAEVLKLNGSISDRQTVAPTTTPEVGFFGLADYDSDGLDNTSEIALGTDYFAWDTDGDGIHDSLELEMGFDPLSDDSVGDADLDGWNNAQEVIQGTRPFEDDRGQDFDGDGLSTETELAQDLRPDKADTDGDGVDDGDELSAGTDPLLNDSDGDGILDGVDANPLSADQPNVLDTTGMIEPLVLSGTHVYTDIVIATGTTVRGAGSEPLRLVSTGNAVISGTIDIKGEGGMSAVNTATSPALGGQAVAGGRNGGSGAFEMDGSGGAGQGSGQGGRYYSANDRAQAGGGGGGFATAGEDGTESSSSGYKGLGGSAYNSILIDPMQGGSGGGGGGRGRSLATAQFPTSTCGGGGGGAGGGTLYLRVAGVLTISASGEINADGGAGGNGAKVGYNAAGGGGGGGSGGAIYLKAATLDNNGNIHAVGGAYGFGSENSTTARGGAGALGRIRIDADVLKLNGIISGRQTIAATTTPEVGFFGLADYDSDGLDNALELEIGTNFKAWDSDGDGIHDGQEYQAGLDPWVNDASDDDDNDGWNNAQEALQGTRPTEDDRGQDFDGDGLDTETELAQDLRPDKADTDGDGVDDGDELSAGTDPILNDSDGDGILDGADANPLSADQANILDTTGMTEPLVLSGTHVYTDIVIASGTTVRGAGLEPLRLISTGNAVISGTIDIKGEDGMSAVNTATSPAYGGQAVAGGRNGGNGAYEMDGSYGAGQGSGQGGRYHSTSDRARAGGGGGGFATAGEDGTEWSSSGYKGLGGSVYNSVQIDPLEGGSGGGGGGRGVTMATAQFPTSSSGGGGGGAGGGALYLQVAGVLTISASGEINADGGAGGNGTKVSYHVAGGGGGGGSGGAIYLRAATLDNNGNLHAIGGTYGFGSENSTTARGGAGGEGRIRLVETGL